MTTLTKPSAATPLENALLIPLGLMAPSPLNPRKRWSTERVADMAASLVAVGQVQPIRVRPNPEATGTNGRPPYEIVVGETRWRAAPDAQLLALEAIVGQYTDQQVIEIALAENTKRGDLHPLEEADAYDALLRKPDGLQGYPSVQELAAHLGTSPSYVYQRLKLRALCPAGREAFLAGRIDASVALLIARMPDQAEQARATARIVAGWGGEAYSYRQAAEFVQREFMLRLSLARFDPAAAYQVAGPCSDCPKRSGAAPDLFADVTSGDMCQDARCYQAKGTEAHLQLLQAARDAGRTVLQGAAARKVMASPTATPLGHARLDAPCPALTDSARPLRELLGQGFTGAIVVVDFGEDQAPVELVPSDVAAKAIKARGLLRSQTTKPAKPSAQPAKPSPTTKPADDTDTDPEAEHTSPAPAAHTPSRAGTAKPETPRPAPAPLATPQAGGRGQGKGGGEEEEQRKAAALLARRKKFGELLASGLSAALANADDLGLAGLRLAVYTGMDALTAEALQLLAVVRGWVPYEHTGPVFYGRRMEEADGRELGELLVMLQVIEQLSDGPSMGGLGLDQDVRGLCEAYGLNIGATWYEAQIAAAPQGDAGSAAGDAGREPDATEAFLQQHGEAGESAAPATTTEAVEPWEFPKNHI